jgi:hypothetical protein
MHIPPFSIFSAVSELFVTAGVVYVIARNWNRRPFPLGLFLTVAVFEAFVNVLYMATKTARAAAGTEAISTGMKIAFAAHGLLSLLAYLIFVVLGVIAWQEQRAALPALILAELRARPAGSPAEVRARRLRAPLLLALWALLAFEAAGGIVIFIARLAFGRTPGEAFHVAAGVALTVVYAIYQWRHWRRVGLQRGFHFVIGVLAASFMALANLTGLALGAVWWRDRVAGNAVAAAYPPALSAVHNIGSMLVLTFAGAHLAAVLMRDRRLGR